MKPRNNEKNTQGGIQSKQPVHMFIISPVALVKVEVGYISLSTDVEVFFYLRILRRPVFVAYTMPWPANGIHLREKQEYKANAGIPCHIT